MGVVESAKPYAVALTLTVGGLLGITKLPKIDRGPEAGIEPISCFAKRENYGAMPDMVAERLRNPEDLVGGRISTSGILKFGGELQTTIRPESYIVDLWQPVVMTKPGFDGKLEILLHEPRPDNPGLSKVGMLANLAYQVDLRGTLIRRTDGQLCLTDVEFRRLPGY